MNKRMSDEEFKFLYDKLVKYNAKFCDKTMHDLRLTKKIGTNCHKDKVDSFEDFGYEYYAKYSRLSTFIRARYRALTENDKSIKTRYGRSQGVCTLLEDLMEEIKKIESA